MTTETFPFDHNDIPNACMHRCVWCGLYKYRDQPTETSCPDYRGHYFKLPDAERDKIEERMRQKTLRYLGNNTWTGLSTYNSSLGAPVKYCLNCGQREENDRKIVECSRSGGHLFSEIGLDKAIAAVRTLLQTAGYDPSDDDLMNTPTRVIRALMEMTAGEREDPKEILGKEFDAGCDGVVILRDIHFTSLCEHHLLPFVGTADVGYVPGPQGKVVGLSKLARLVECFARRLQLQEALTQEIAQALMEHLKPKGAAVVIRAHHSCMGCRGVRKQDAEMVTSEMLGVFRDKPEARAEFLALCRS